MILKSEESKAPHVKETVDSKNNILSNMQTEALKSQIESIAQKHYVCSINSKFKI